MSTATHRGRCVAASTANDTAPNSSWAVCTTAADGERHGPELQLGGLHDRRAQPPDRQVDGDRLAAGRRRLLAARHVVDAHGRSDVGADLDDDRRALVHVVGGGPAQVDQGGRHPARVGDDAGRGVGHAQVGQQRDPPGAAGADHQRVEAVHRRHLDVGEVGEVLGGERADRGRCAVVDQVHHHAEVGAPLPRVEAQAGRHQDGREHAAGGERVGERPRHRDLGGQQADPAPRHRPFTAAAKRSHAAGSSPTARSRPQRASGRRRGEGSSDSRRSQSSSDADT